MGGWGFEWYVDFRLEVLGDFHQAISIRQFLSKKV
jgi:hypothetical protein